MRAGEKFRWEEDGKGERGRRHLWQGGRKKKEYKRMEEGSRAKRGRGRELKVEEDRRKVQVEGG